MQTRNNEREKKRERERKRDVCLDRLMAEGEDGIVKDLGDETRCRK